MAQQWREILKELDVEPESAAGPAGAAGDWFQLHASFGTKSFVRLLTDGEEVAVECAPPGKLEAAVAAFGDEWSVEGDRAPFVARIAFPVDADGVRDLWVRLAKLSDAVRDEDVAAFLEAAHGTSPPDTEEAAEDVRPDDESAESEGSPPSSTAFESIGDSEVDALPGGSFAWTLSVEGEEVHVALGFGDALDRDDYETLEKRVVRNLRGKYDVTARVAPGDELSLRLERAPTTRLLLVVEPDQVVGKATVEDAERWVGEYFETLETLAASGIDPLVFLGVQSSRRPKPTSDPKSSSFEPIGTGQRDEATDEESAGDDEGDDDGIVLMVSDEDDGLDEESAAEVVFGAASVPDPDDPLEPGRYDDPRLKRPDASTALVDVVLRHPGYSDKSISQVLSILLSIDYSASLELARTAPTVIAWGVARERAHTMKTVVEGAGGRILLVEPGTFGEE